MSEKVNMEQVSFDAAALEEIFYSAKSESDLKSDDLSEGLWRCERLLKNIKSLIENK